jgi:hypothetical protein
MEDVMKIVNLKQTFRMHGNGGNIIYSEGFNYFILKSQFWKGGLFDHEGSFDVGMLHYTLNDCGEVYPFHESSDVGKSVEFIPCT